MLGFIPPAVRLHLPPFVLAMGALSSLSVAIQLLVGYPELPLLSVSFFGTAGLQAAGAWGLYKHRFWARGFAVGSLLASALVVGLWMFGFGLTVPVSVVAALILLDEDAPGRYERRVAFLEEKSLDAAGARRLFFVGLGLGVGLTALLGSPLSVLLLLLAPVPTALACGLGVLAFIGLTRLASWCYVAMVGAVVSLVVAIVMSALEQHTHAAQWGTLCAALIAAATLPLTGPVVRHLRSV